MNEVGLIVARLRLAAASAEIQIEELVAHAKEARAIADELTRDPETLLRLHARAVALFVRATGRNDVEFAVRKIVGRAPARAARNGEGGG